MPRPDPGFDWTNVLDFDAALVSLHYEFQGDWYRDPWGWPELDWVVKSDVQLLANRLNGHGVRRVAKVDVPKENFGTRPAIVMDAVDRLIYQALVDRQSAKLIGKLPEWVFGWRLQQSSPTAGNWSHNDLQHAAFRDVLSVGANMSSAAIRTDIVSCFASIDVERLCEMVQKRSGSGRVTDRLTDLVRGWGSVAGRSGLAQRSAASAALANMYLEPIDDVLRDHDKPRRRGRNKSSGMFRRLASLPRVARWMDDLWVFGRDGGELRVVQLELQDALRSIGLEMNHAKTELLEGDDVVHEVLRIQHSAIDGALSGDAPDSQPLIELVEKLLEHPTQADRTSVKFVTRRMRVHRLYHPVLRFAEHAHEMPHVADALGRLFRDSEHWRDLPNWFVHYAQSPWGVIRWSVAQLGTAFPSKLSTRADSAKLSIVKDYFFRLLDEEPPLPLLALAAQRLASWDSGEARSAFRSAATSSGDAQVRRVLALASANAQEDRAVIRNMLSEFEENVVTLRMLEERSFRVPVKSDFEGS